MELLERIYKRLLTKTDTKFYRFLYYNIDWSQPLIGIKGQRGVGKINSLAINILSHSKYTNIDTKATT